MHLSRNFAELISVDNRGPWYFTTQGVIGDGLYIFVVSPRWLFHNDKQDTKTIFFNPSLLICDDSSHCIEVKRLYIVLITSQICQATVQQRCGNDCYFWKQLDTLNPGAHDFDINYILSPWILNLWSNDCAQLIRHRIGIVSQRWDTALRHDDIPWQTFPQWRQSDIKS